MNERDIFTAAREMTDPVARSAYLDGACGGDPGLRSRVEALLRAHDQPDSLLDCPAVAAHDPDPDATQALTGTPEPAVSTSQTAAGENTPADDEALSFLAPPRRPDSLGRIGHYEVLQVLGRGGFGIVFRAFDDVLHRVVAVKLLAPQLAATSPARKRFLREARSSAQIRHENVVQVYEIGEQPLPYLAMEFIPGETLQQRLDRVGPVEPAEVVRVGRQIAEGLAAAHANDLIHRDIKPGNVLLEGGAGRVRITDFGLARAADDASISQSGIIAGTPMYMAPEQAQGHKLDQRADLFSLGSVLYTMVTGRPPFRANGTVAVLKRVAEDTPRDIREIIPETPQWLCAIIAKLHAKDPGERYQSAREVAEVLADCEAQLKANARLKDYSRIPRSKPRRPGRRKWLAAAAVMMLPVIALAVTETAEVTHLLRGQQGTPDPSNSGGPAQAGVGAGWNGWPADAPPPAMAPFDAARARAHQEAWAKYLGVPVEFTNSIGMKFMIVPPGKFTMGSSKEEIDFWVKQNLDDWIKERMPTEGPQHEIEITRPFYMGQTEVTVGQFRRFVQAKQYKTQAEREGGAYRNYPNGFKLDPNRNWLNPGSALTDDHPVVCVSWNDAVEFCDWLSKQEGRDCRLPTEAEWEYSCRAGSTGRWSFGGNEDELSNYARIGSMSQAHSWPVAELEENAWGLHDTHGNVWEWCHDVFDADYYKVSPPKDPPGPGTGDRRVLRGGCWAGAPVDCRCTFRGCLPPGHRDDAQGFRVVMVALPPAGVRTGGGAKGQPSSTAIAPFTDADVRRIAALPAAEQVEEVRKELMRRNPGFDGTVGHSIEGDVVTELRINTDKVTDIAPIRVFGALRVLECGGTITAFKPNGRLKDLTPLKGMNLAGLTYLNLINTKVADSGMVYFEDCKDLTYLNLANTKVTDRGLARFKGCKNLTILDLTGTKVTDGGLAHFEDCKNLTGLYAIHTEVGDAGLAHLQDCKALTHLYLAGTQVGDAGLAHFKGMPLMMLWIHDTGITDLSPLQGMPLEEVRLTPKRITRGLEILRDMKSLKTIGIDWDRSWPAAEFWGRYDNGEFGAVPLTDADVRRIAALPAEQQVEEVRKELMKRNPGFDGKLEHKIEDGVVTEFKIVTDPVTDIAPIRVFNALRVLECRGQFTNKSSGLLSDLTPLQGMNLAELTHLNLRDTKVSDAGMVYFKDCTSLTTLILPDTPVGDAGLAHFKNCKALEVLDLGRTRVGNAGLDHFRDFKALAGLWLGTTNVDDAGLSRFRDCKSLTFLDLSVTRVSDAGVANFQDCKALTRLILADTKVGDAGLAHFKNMPLMLLWIHNSGITDLTPLQGMPLEDIRLTPKNITKGLDILRDMKSLKTIGVEWDKVWPAAEFWARYDNGEFGVAPFTDADVRRIAALPAAEQVERVRKELMRRNPGFDGKVEHKVEDGVVTDFRIVTDQVTDISPIRSFDSLRALDCGGTNIDKPNGLLADLTPLKGMSLAGLTHLFLGNTKVTDAGLAAFKNCKDLTTLHLYWTNVSDAGLVHFLDCKDLTDISLAGTKVRDVGLAHFKDCENLTHLHVDHTQVGDAGLARLKGLPLMSLWIDHTAITDLTPLQGMPLEDVRLTPRNITRGLDVLRDMKSLKTIGIDWDRPWPAAEFWERYDKGEFKE